MDWEDIYLALKSIPPEEREARNAVKPTFGDKAALAIFRALLKAQIAAEPGTQAAYRSLAQGAKKRDFGLHFPSAEKARVETGYFENVAIPFYTGCIVDGSASDPAAGGKHHDEILALRRLR